jgi:hypothetical protein
VNYQDLLLFDPVDGALSLRRLVIDKHAVKESIGSGVAASVQALGATSISLPGMGGAGRLGSSPSTSAVVRGGSKGSHSQQSEGDPLMELEARDIVVATWNLKRKRNRAEFKRAVEPTVPIKRRGGVVGGEYVFSFDSLIWIVD